MQCHRLSAWTRAGQLNMWLPRIRADAMPAAMLALQRCNVLGVATMNEDACPLPPRTAPGTLVNDNQLRLSRLPVLPQCSYPPHVAGKRILQSPRNSKPGKELEQFQSGSHGGVTEPERLGILCTHGFWGISHSPRFMSAAYNVCSIAGDRPRCTWGRQHCGHQSLLERIPLQTTEDLSVGQIISLALIDVVYVCRCLVAPCCRSAHAACTCKKIGEVLALLAPGEGHRLTADIRAVAGMRPSTTSPRCLSHWSR